MTAIEYSAAQVLALLDEERQRSLRLANELEAYKRTVQRVRTLISAYQMLGRSRGFTEQDARTEWKNAGYGGL